MRSEVLSTFHHNIQLNQLNQLDQLDQHSYTVQWSPTLPQLFQP